MANAGNITITIKLGPVAKLVIEFYTLAAEYADLLPEFLPERDELLRRMRELSECIRSCAQPERVWKAPF